MKFFPKFPNYAARLYYANFIKSDLDPWRIRNEIDIKEVVGMSKVPIGDTIDLEEFTILRGHCIDELANNNITLDSPPNNYTLGKMDRILSIILYTQLSNHLLPGMAADIEMWNYINLCVFPDLVVYRWKSGTGVNQKINPERFFSITRNYFGTLWWRAYFFNDIQAENPWWLFDLMTEDNFVAITERTRLRGYTGLPLELARKLVDLQAYSSSHSLRQNIFRRMILLFRVKASCTNMLIVQERPGMLKELIDEVFHQACTDLGIVEEKIKVSSLKYEW